ncbi:MAG TPA: glycosyltransferase [Pyrinomonadaceae bacterium]|nr:glycosyltransferase [Pyrinomonadaceae bacterium]
MSAPDLSIVIPALNEADNLRLLLPLIQNVIGELGIKAETIVVDGGSTDDSSAVAAAQNARFIEQSERGYGGALLAGFAAAQAPYLATMDADLSHPPIFIKDFWRERLSADVLIASRYVRGGRADMALSRRFLSTILNRTYSILLGVRVRDLSSGFRMYKAAVINQVNFQGRDFDALEEILVRIRVGGGRIKEVPFHYQVRQSGKSHVKLMKFGWAFSKTLLRMCRLRYLK